MNEIRLDVGQLDIIQNVLSKIPHKMDSFFLRQSYNSLDSSVLTVEFECKMGDIEGTFSTVIEKW